VADAIRFDLSTGLALLGADVEEVWWRYAALGGTLDLELMSACVAGRRPCDELDRDLIAQALNEAYLDRGLDTFPVGYARELELVPGNADLDALVLAAGPALRECGGTIRERAVEARRRSMVAAQTAAALHLTSARLMAASGQLKYARQARQRAIAAAMRSRRAVAC
jgi:hypothetical protein